VALQSSGAISLNDVQTEFGGSNPIAISEYYGVAAGVPASGTIALDDFYGTSAFSVNYSLEWGYNSKYEYTYVSTAGNRKKWTYSLWVRRANGNRYQGTIGVNVSGNTAYFGFTDTNRLRLLQGGGTIVLETNATYAVGDWYHLVLTYDTAQATASNRVKLYVNGSQITSFATTSYPSQNSDGPFMSVNYHYVLNAWNNSLPLFGWFADVHFCDGYAYQASDFGYNNGGTWSAKGFSGSHGSQGFYQRYELNLNDSTGNRTFDSNNFTTNDCKTSVLPPF
jgi:hypothetical protein